MLTFWQSFFPEDISWVQLLILIVSAMLIGINKTALPGIGVLPVVLLTLVFEPRLSVGVQLVMLAMTDVVAVLCYRRTADWKIVLKLLPWAWAGLGIGSLILHGMGEESRLLKPLIGGIVLALTLLNFIRRRLTPEKVSQGGLVGAGCGLLLGTTTQIANAAGPVAAIYFLAMKLPKEIYLGCSAWFFLIINWTKLPLFIAEGRITWEGAKLSLSMIPFLLFGAFLGCTLLKKMPQQIFEAAIQVLIVLSALKLFF